MRENVKPAYWQVVLKRLMLRAAEAIAAERGAEIVYADLRLDPVAHKVWRGGNEIDLTAKEYELLELFMRNPRQVLTRDIIFDRVWGYDFGGESNIIEVYVRYLRQKTEDDDLSRLIHTVRGVGYVLRESE